jgi:putative Mn2+ efflux pump MntP
MPSGDVSWNAIILIVIGALGFLIGVYFPDVKGEIQKILAKHTLRWESPLLIAIGAAIDSVSIDTIILAAVPAFLILSGIGTWQVFREVAERKKRGETFGDER